MKHRKTFLTVAILSCMALQAKAELKGDTLVIENADKVRIETRDTVQRIVINGSKDDPQFHYVQRITIPDTSAVRRTIKSVKDFNKINIKGKRDEDSKWDTSIHVNLGLNSLLNADEGYDFKLWPSMEIGLTALADYHPYGPQNEWSVGLTLDWRNYQLADDKGFMKTNNWLTLYPYTDSQQERDTWLKTVSLGIPLMYTHYFGRNHDWGISLGAIVNWNFYTRACNRFEIDDEQHEIRIKKIGQQPLTVDGIAILHTPFIRFYCKYCPMKLFKDDRGPKANQLSFGLYW